MESQRPPDTRRPLCAGSPAPPGSQAQGAQGAPEQARGAGVAVRRRRDGWGPELPGSAEQRGGQRLTALPRFLGSAPLLTPSDPSVAPREARMSSEGWEWFLGWSQGLSCLLVSRGALDTQTT